MSITRARWDRSLVHAWIMWSQEASPLHDEGKAVKLWSRSSEKIKTGLAQMGLSGLLPVEQEVNTNV